MATRAKAETVRHTDPAEQDAEAERADLTAAADAYDAARLAKSPEPQPERIHVLMARILGELPAIGKKQRNTQQNFNFRGIDDVLNALNDLLGKYGVFYVPRCLERVTDERATRAGSALYVVNLHIEFTFYGPRGDSVTATMWGEGSDSGDKSTSKAATAAQKYALVQVFSIATEEGARTDADQTSPEETTGSRRFSQPRQQRPAPNGTPPPHSGTGPPPAAATPEPPGVSYYDPNAGWTAPVEATQAHEVLSENLKSLGPLGALIYTRHKKHWPMNRADFDAFCEAVKVEREKDAAEKAAKEFGAEEAPTA